MQEEEVHVKMKPSKIVREAKFEFFFLSINASNFNEITL